MIKRTHTCGELRSKQINQKVTLNGWVNTVRWHGQVVFIDIRDRYGKMFNGRCTECNRDC